MFKWLDGNSTTNYESLELGEVQPTFPPQAPSESGAASLRKIDSSSSVETDHSLSQLKDYDSYRHFLDQGRDLIEPRNEFLDNALQALDKFRWWNVEDFLEPWGWQQVTIIHLAAHRGKIDTLERAIAMYAPGANSAIDSNGTKINPLFATDKLGRCALHYAASEGHSGVASWILEQTGPESSGYSQLSLEDVFGRTPLHDAAGSLHVDVVKILVNAGAAVNVPNRKRVPPYLPAASDEVVQKANTFELHPDDLLRYEKMVEIFIEKKVDVNFQHPKDGFTSGWTMLYYALFLGSQNATKRLLENGALQRRPSIVNKKSQELVLVFAVRFYRNLECIRLLVDDGGNLAKITPALGQATVLEELVTYLEDRELVTFLTELLDARIHPIKDEEDSAILDYKILLPEDEPQMAVFSVLIKAMRSTELQSILKHPLLQAYIGEKWSHLSKVFYIFLFLYVIFVIALSGYTIDLVYENHDSSWLRYSILVLALIFFCYNLQQFVAEPIKRVVTLEWHIRHFENWLMFISLTITMAVAIAGAFVPNVSTPWILQALSIANPISWMQIVLFLGRIPALDLLDIRYYALLFSIVLKHVFKVLFIGFLIIVGFSFSFFILLNRNKQFEHPLDAFTKVLLMMAGEFDYDELFNFTSVCNSTDLYSDYPNQINEILNSIIIRVVFITFVIIINIVFMNLTIGLVISDVQALEKQGQCNRLLQRGKFIADFERIAKYFGSQTWIPECLKNWLMESTEISKEGEVCEETQPALWRDVTTVFQRKDRRQKFKMMKSRLGNKAVSLGTIQSALTTMESSHQSMMNQIQYMTRGSNGDAK